MEPVGNRNLITYPDLPQTPRPELMPFLELFPMPEGPVTADLLVNTLRKYQIFIKLSQEALINLKRRVMSFFDPLGGEHGCHIRAAYFAELLNSNQLDQLIQEGLDQLTAHASMIKALIEDPSTKSSKASSFYDFLEEKNPLLLLPEEILVIISSCFLSETKVIEYRKNEIGIPSRHESIPYKEFSEKKGVSANYARAIIKMAQEQLSRLSVTYVQRVAAQVILNKEFQIATDLVFGRNVRLDQRRRHLTPCYSTMRLLLERMRIRKTPLVVKVSQHVKGCEYSYNKLTLVFACQDGKEYTLVTDYKPSFLNGAVVVVHAKSITEKAIKPELLHHRIMRQPITELILSSAANHPQYGGDDTDAPVDPEREEYREMALEWGTCRENPSVLLIDHIHCDMLDISEKGELIENIYLSSKLDAFELYKQISRIGEFSTYRLRLFSSGKIIFRNIEWGKTPPDFEDRYYWDGPPQLLTYGSRVRAHEFRENPTQRVYPDRIYKVIIHD